MAKKKTEKSLPQADIAGENLISKRKTEALSFSLKNWDWPFDFPSDLARDAYLDELMGINPLFSDEERRRFVASLHGSYSLEVEEKKRVIFAYPSLSRFQYDELLKTFDEETVKFIELQKMHPNDIRKLDNKAAIQWASIVAAKDGMIRLYSHLSKDQLLDANALQFIADMVEEFTTEDSAYSVARICDECIDSMIEGKLYEDEELSGSYKFFVRHSIFIQAYIQKLSYGSPLFNYLVERVEKYPPLEDFTPKEFFYHSIFMKQGFSLFDGKPEEDEFKIAVSAMPRTLSFAVPFREMYTGNTNDLIEGMLTILRFNASNKAAFNRQIDDQIDNLSFEGLSAYIKHACNIFAIFYAFTGRNLALENGEHGSDFGKIYSLIKSRLKRTPHGVDLKYAGNFKLLIYLLEGRELNIEASKIEGDHLWHKIRTIGRGKIDIERVIDSFASHKYLQKSDAYQIAVYVYATALAQISNPNEWDFREVQEKSVIIFTKIHVKYQISISEEEITQFHGYLSPPKHRGIEERLKKLKSQQREAQTTASDD